MVKLNYFILNTKGKKMDTIAESEMGLEQTLGDTLETFLPQIAGYSIEVEIHESGRKKRRDASRDGWRPGSGEIRIKFGGAAPRHRSHKPDDGDQREPGLGDIGIETAEANDTDLGRLSDFIESLRMAEQRPGFNFVSLTWFRDSCLPGESHGWSNSATARDQVLRDAIKDGIVLTSKVPNPKAPAFPVTAIRLNRQHPKVVAVLGEREVSASGFQPVDIGGEPLSETVLRDRR